MHGDIIQEYSFKRGFSQDNERIHDLLKKNFPSDINVNDGKHTLSYGAFKQLIVWTDKKKLCVETESANEVEDNMILDTNKRFRIFLEEATGYSAKERLKQAKKAVQGD